MAEEIAELPGIPIDPTPLISEAVGALWRLILAITSGWLSAHTSLSPEFLNDWQGNALKVFTALTMALGAYYLSLRKLRKAAKARAALAQVVEDKKEVIKALQ